MSGKVISITRSEQAAVKARQEELSQYREQGFLRSIDTINRALQKAGEEPRTLVHLFLHMSMVLSDGGFKNLLAQNQQGTGVIK